MNIYLMISEKIILKILILIKFINVNNKTYNLYVLINRIFDTISSDQNEIYKLIKQCVYILLMY